MLELQRLADQVIELLQLGFKRRDLAGGAFLRLGQRRGDAFEIGGDLRQLRRLRTQRFGHPFYLGGVVDRVIAILVVPGGVEAATGHIEGVIGLGAAAARIVEKLLPGPRSAQGYRFAGCC
ncbi:hypothetical protein AB8998_19480 [Mycobacterium sp. HUMS_12744610]|uniref:Uncharacterized protein n=1 Tax=Mycobacterium servetii TaxID=3237418 RepID=A0ABV4C3B1_9MYCO